jgi:hypothetical protein
LSRKQSIQEGQISFFIIEGKYFVPAFETEILIGNNTLFKSGLVGIIKHIAGNAEVLCHKLHSLHYLKEGSNPASNANYWPIELLFFFGI